MLVRSLLHTLLLRRLQQACVQLNLVYLLDWLPCVLHDAEVALFVHKRLSALKSLEEIRFVRLLLNICDPVVLVGLCVDVSLE